MAEILCPYCFKRFKTDEVMLQCDNKSTRLEEDGNGEYIKVPVCKFEEDQEFSDHWGTKVQTKHIFSPHYGFLERMGWKHLQGKPCDKCGSISMRFVCPHCHNWLPPEMIERGAQIISVIGGPDSGKTNYIVTLVHELREYCNKLGLSVTLQEYGRNKDEYTTNIYKKMKERIFDQHCAVPKTLPKVGEQPIPWLVRIESKKTGKAVYLVFYDTAGERFDNTTTMQDLKYFQESEACIVVFDTLAIPRIKKILASKGTEVYGEAYDYRDTLTTLKVYMEARLARNVNKKPFAFVFSKFDVVIDNQEALNCDVSDFTDNKGKFTNSSFIDKGGFSLKQVNSASQSISDYLHAKDVWDQDAFAEDIESTWGDNGHYFGVSALGAMTDAALVIQSDEVTPIRVLDPLVWILYKLGGFGIPLEEEK